MEYIIAQKKERSRNGKELFSDFKKRKFQKKKNYFQIQKEDISEKEKVLSGFLKKKYQKKNKSLQI